MRATPEYTTEIISRFYSNVSTIPTENGCLEWMGYCDSLGYGLFGIVKDSFFAHRVAWEIVNGPIPAGLLIRHMCHNPRCVNHAHLLTGTHADNNRDMMSSGRFRNAPNTYVRPVRPTVAERFYAKVSKTPTETGCLEWLSSRNDRGYGTFFIGGRSVGAHRVAWELVNGPIPPGLCVLHRCDRPSCCRIEHLWLGDRAENNRDMCDKGRNLSFSGEESGNVKLTNAQVLEMRSEKFAGLKQWEIAKLFGITQSMAGRILRREAWKHI